jgi:hypothetical protein
VTAFCGVRSLWVLHLSESDITPKREAPSLADLTRNGNAPDMWIRTMTSSLRLSYRSMKKGGGRCHRKSGSDSIPTSCAPFSRSAVCVPPCFLSLSQSPAHDDHL